MAIEVNRANSPEAHALKAEREAQLKIQNANKMVREAQVQANEQIETIKDQYVGQSQKVATQNSAALESQKQKGYDDLLRNKKELRKPKPILLNQKIITTMQ
jgi:hypothetical protein